LARCAKFLENVLHSKGKEALGASPRLPVETLEVCVFDDHAHRAQVTSLWSQVFGYETAHNAPPLAIERKLAVADGLLFVATRAGSVVGSTSIAHAERALAAKGCLKINLQIVASNERVAAFYSTLGYVVEKCISMGKVLYS
jgi:hypothetical protein